MTNLNLFLGIFFIKATSAFVWLTVNDKNTTSYDASESATTSITIICHQQLYWGDRSWLDASRSISRFSSTCADSQNLPNCTEDAWNYTLKRSTLNGNTLFVDSRRAVVTLSGNTSPKYNAMGYTIIAPVTEDSGVYRCRGTYISENRQAIEEISEHVNIVIQRAAQDTTVMTINFNSVSSIENDSPQRLIFRCHTYSLSRNATVVLHRIYKKQNLTRQDSYGVVSSSMTSWTLIYDSGENLRSVTPFINIAPTTRLSSQDLTSGFDITHRGYGDTGYYFCSASCISNGNNSFTVDSREVFLDSRRKPFITAAIMATNSPMIKRHCFYNDEEQAVNYHLCKTYKNDSLTLSCSIFTRDFIPKFKVTIGADDANDLKPYFYPSEDEYEFDDSNPFQSVVFEGRVTKSFYAVEMCEDPLVSCSAWFPDSPYRLSQRIIRLISDFCDNDSIEALRNQASGYTTSD